MNFLSRFAAMLGLGRSEAPPAPAVDLPRAVPVLAVGDPAPADARGSGVPPLAVEIVAHFEGLRLAAYLCPAKVWTVGYGSTRIWGRPVRDSDRLRDEAEARALLARDLADAAAAVDRAVTVPLAEHQRAALISIVQNVGAGRADRPGQPGRSGIVTLRDGRSSTLLANVNARAVAAAGDAFLAWTKAGGVDLPGLVRRRRAERAMWRGENWLAVL
jgi:GH24 family phage-related lysozyme (muramidase)